ncbi:MAG: hypothetical protein WAN48_05085 [Actinomycetes bacterium]
MTDGVRRAYLHVGAPKTGTTYLQGVLWRNQDALEVAGLLVVGGRRRDHYLAGHDLRDMPFEPGDPGLDWTGTWDALAKLAVASDVESVIVSDEHLASLKPAQVQRAVDALAPREVHVIYATRNLSGLMPSEWQEYVKHRSKLTFEAWSKKVLGSATRGPGRWFWSVHDPVDVVDRWATAVPREHIHVMTMPPRSAGPHELWRRFAAIIGIDPEAATDFEVEANTSLGLAETELLRRVNQALPDDFPRWHQTGLARDVLASKILGARSASGRPQLPAPLHEKLAERAAAAVSGLRASGCDVVGDLDDLVVPETPEPGDPPATDADVLDAAVDAVSGLLVQMAWMRDDRQRWEGRLRRQLDSVAPSLRLRSRLVALEHRNKLAGSVIARLRTARNARHG